MTPLMFATASTLAKGVLTISLFTTTGSDVKLLRSFSLQDVLGEQYSVGPAPPFGKSHELGDPYRMWMTNFHLDPTGKYLAVKVWESAPGSKREGALSRLECFIDTETTYLRVMPLAMAQPVRFAMRQGEPVFAVNPGVQRAGRMSLRTLLWDKMANSWATGFTWKENSLRDSWSQSAEGLVSYLNSQGYIEPTGFNFFEARMVSPYRSLPFLNPDEKRALVKTQLKLQDGWGSTLRSLVFEHTWKERWHYDYRFVYEVVEAEGVTFIQGLQDGDNALSLRIVNSVTGSTITVMPAHHFAVAGYDLYSDFIPWPQWGDSQSMSSVQRAAKVANVRLPFHATHECPFTR